MYELQEGRNGVMDFMAYDQFLLVDFIGVFFSRLTFFTKNGQSFLFAVLQINVQLKIVAVLLIHVALLRLLSVLFVKSCLACYRYLRQKSCFWLSSRGNIVEMIVLAPFSSTVTKKIKQAARERIRTQ